MRSPSYRPARLVAAGALIGAMTFAPTAAQAWDQRIEDGVHHYVECFKFMVTDQASHKAFCSPSRAGEWYVPESNYSRSPPPVDACDENQIVPFIVIDDDGLCPHGRA